MRPTVKLLSVALFSSLLIWNMLLSNAQVLLWSLILQIDDLKKKEAHTQKPQKITIMIEYIRALEWTLIIILKICFCRTDWIDPNKVYIQIIQHESAAHT